MATPGQYCTFFVDGQYFGVSVLRVQEIIRYQELTRVPLAPPSVRGLINLRGQIVTAIDLRRRLDLGERPPDQLPLNVVVQTDDGAVSLLVDQIGNVLDVPEHMIETPPDTVHGPARALLVGVHQAADGLLQILNVDDVVNLASGPK
ncbi:MAG: chemotaxis protein CheW [Phycisphaerales bacterium]|nr:chemotaxis protein CheW [Phycisphaerales bacterium]